MSIIEDGTGTGYRLKISETNRAKVNAETVTLAELEAYKGNAYNINTGNITLTSAGESHLLYMKNTSTVNDINITAFFYLLGTNTGGTGDHEVSVYINPTGGTLISNATDVEMNVNRDLGSSNTLPANVYKGAEGTTATGGTKMISSLFSSVGRQTVSVGLIRVPPGKSLSISVKPATGTTNMTVQLAMSVYKRTEEIE